MDQWLRQTSQGHDMFSYDPEVMGLNLSCVELWVQFIVRLFASDSKEKMKTTQIPMKFVCASMDI